MRFPAAPAGVILLLALSLGACKGGAPAPEPEATEVPEELAATPPPAVAAAGIGTPMEERVAVLGLLNKRNNITRTIEMKPGESRRVLGDVVLRLSACERTPPWEQPPETGAFVQVLVQDRADAGAQARWQQVFSGWLFRNAPSLNVVEHPIYDVWVKDCRMSFPGQDAPAPAEEPSTAAPRPSAPTAAPAPQPEAAPEPAPEPAAPTNEA